MATEENSSDEKLAQKFKLNLESAMGREILSCLDEKVEAFVAKYRRAAILRELPGEMLKMTVGEALKFSTKVRKLLTDGRFQK